MASATTPTHGKLGAIYCLRPNGFKGDGLNDVTWGTAFSGAASAYFEAVIDHIDSIKTVTIGAGGTGYVATDVLTVVQTGGSGGTVTVDTVDGGGAVTAISLTTVGEGYAVADGLATTGGTGSGCTINITALEDSFKWRKDGGAWTEDVAITGAAQTLSDTQTITFTATTGHTVSDQWVIGNFKDEACTESGTEAQITDATKRILNLNATPTFTDSGGENVLIVDHTRGKAIFGGNVTVVDVDGNNGFVPLSGLEKVGYLLNWEFTPELGFADITAMGDDWEDQIAGVGKFAGSAGGFFIGADSFFHSFKEGVESGEAFFLQLFTWDPDKDQTGDHYNAWAIFNSFNLSVPAGEAVKESISFKGSGIPSFTANV